MLGIFSEINLLLSKNIKIDLQKICEMVTGKKSKYELISAP